MQRLILSFCLLGLLTACGQKGDLYLPDKNPNKNTSKNKPAPIWTKKT